MPNKKKTDFAPHIPLENAPPCHIAGCAAPGAYKAPRSRDALHDYRWFCLEHIREHNQQWDFFSGMDSHEIEHFIKDAVTGHRPTWSREQRIRRQYQQLQDALYEFLSSGYKKPAQSAPHVTAKMRRALAVLDMIYPCTAKELKGQYRSMVKKYHPDLNRGDKQSEEKFKKITAAYHYLRDHIKNL